MGPPSSSATVKRSTTRPSRVEASDATISNAGAEQGLRDGEEQSGPIEGLDHQDGQPVVETRLEGDSRDRTAPRGLRGTRLADQLFERRFAGDQGGEHDADACDIALQDGQGQRRVALEPQEVNGFGTPGRRVGARVHLSGHDIELVDEQRRADERQEPRAVVGHHAENGTALGQPLPHLDVNRSARPAGDDRGMLAYRPRVERIAVALGHRCMK